jgi:hypothetical protein
MALIAFAECNLVVVTGEALFITRVVGHGNEPLFLSLKQLFSRHGQARMAIHAHVAIGSVHTVVEGNRSLPSSPVIECLRVSTHSIQAEEAQE